MGKISIRDLKSKYGITQGQIDEARQQQEAQRRAGMPVQSLAVQLEIEPPKRSGARLGEVIGYNRTPEPDTIHQEQIEYDFFRGGNVSTAFQYQDAITERLFDAAKTGAQAKEALAVLAVICRHIGWQTYECTKTAKELSEILRTDKAQMGKTLALLEEVRAIRRIKKGTSKIITVNPEGAYRGDINEHSKVVSQYDLNVIQGGKRDD